MADWSINIPFRDRDDIVLEVVRAARDADLPADEVQVVDVLARDALERGVATVGGLLDELEDLGPQRARARLDWAREACGLVSATEIDRRREQRRIDARFSDHDIPGPPSWEPLQSCHAQGCSAWPTGPAGNVIEVEVERWFCRRHRDLAQPGDMEKHQPAYYIGVNGRLIPSAREAARIAAEVRKRDEPLEQARLAREEHARREAEALAKVEERYDREEYVSVAGQRVHPRNIKVNP